MKKITSTISIVAIVLMVAISFSSCKKSNFEQHEKGYKYQFHTVNDTAPQPVEGDFVSFELTLYNTDTTFIDGQTLNDRIYPPIYTGDFYDAMTTMHVGDSATFIFDGDSVFHYLFGGTYEYENKEIFFDIKLKELIPSAEFEALMAEQQRQYSEMIEEMRVNEDSIRLQYIKDNNITTKPDADGLYIIKTGTTTDTKITRGSNVAVHYTGKLIDGTVFDSSYSRGTPLTLVAGEGQVIKGWDNALLTMNKGEKATLIIPSALAYAERGAGGAIPPYATLIFDIEVVEVQ